MDVLRTASLTMSSPFLCLSFVSMTLSCESGFYYSTIRCVWCIVLCNTERNAMQVMTEGGKIKLLYMNEMWIAIDLQDIFKVTHGGCQLFSVTTVSRCHHPVLLTNQAHQMNTFLQCPREKSHWYSKPGVYLGRKRTFQSSLDDFSRGVILAVLSNSMCKVGRQKWDMLLLGVMMTHSNNYTLFYHVYSNWDSGLFFKCPVPKEKQGRNISLPKKPLYNSFMKDWEIVK